MEELKLGRGLCGEGATLEGATGGVAVGNLLGRLKQTRRTGWVDRGVPGAESIMEHIGRMTQLSILLGAADSELDTAKMCMMAAVHDAGECLVGDVTPHDSREKLAAKREHEDRATQRLDAIGGAAGKPLGFNALWREFEWGDSKEASAVRQLDKLEMILQAAEYEQMYPELRDGRLDGFFEGSRKCFVHPVIKKWAEEIEALRPLRKEVL